MIALGRNPDWIDLNIHYTVGIVKTGLGIGLFPKFLRPSVVSVTCPGTNFIPTFSLAAGFFPAVARDLMRGVKHLGPIIEGRLKLSNECGNEGVEKPVC